MGVIHSAQRPDGLKHKNPAIGTGSKLNPVINRWCLALPALLLAGVAQAAVQFVQIPASQPFGSISDVGGVPVLPFDQAEQALIADYTTGITTIPGLPTSSTTDSLTVAPGVTKYRMRTGAPTAGHWNSAWENGYAGSLFDAFPQQTATLTLPPRTTAFHVFAESSSRGTFNITATTDSGTSSTAVPVTTAIYPYPNSIPGFGFFTTTPGEFIQTITIDVAAGSSSFVIGLFGIAQAPAAPVPGAATPGAGSAVLNFTAPASTDTGTHPVTGYAASCTPQGGGTAITATGTASPITVSGLAGGTAYDCTVAATSLAGTGPTAAPVAVTPMAAAANVTPVPVLDGWGLGLLGALMAGLGLAQRRRRT